MKTGKRFYDEVKIEVVKLIAADVITTSGGSEVPPDQGGSWGPDF